MSDRAGWAFKAGEEIVPGRRALEKLGGGKRYEVYLAWDEGLSTQVVVKIVRPDQVSDPRSIPDLERETRALERLEHPTLVRHFDAVLEGDRPHLVLEHVPGPTLRKLIKSEGPLPPDRIVPVGARVAGALGYMSAERAVHLDVKPSNVVVEGSPRLIDLSLCRTFEAAAVIKRPVGTRKYMSPEQCDPVGLGPVGSPADVWGLGATLYEAIAGRRAFETPARGKVPDDAPVEVRYPQVAEDPPPLPSAVPPGIGDLILSCLEREAAVRPRAEEVVVVLESLL